MTVPPQRGILGAGPLADMGKICPFPTARLPSSQGLCGQRTRTRRDGDGGWLSTHRTAPAARHAVIRELDQLAFVDAVVDSSGLTAGGHSGSGEYQIARRSPRNQAAA